MIVDSTALPEQAASFATAPVDQPGPTGESNRLTSLPRGVFLCCGSVVPTVQALAVGNAVLAAGIDSELFGRLSEVGIRVDQLLEGLIPKELATLPHLAGVTAQGDIDFLTPIRRALVGRDDTIISLETGIGSPQPFAHEQVPCVDTTAAGGNAVLTTQVNDW
jgi:RHH-type proline utilization regulon transcriptional repressor/proline dehydrogenase/delta 1-pyrroline-5-carboxylate dehydrogenase